MVQASLIAALLYASASLSPAGNITIQGDPNEWVIVDQVDNERVSTTVLLRPDENLASWYEMLTFMTIKGPDVPRVVANNLRDRLLMNCPESSFEFHREASTDVLYEFRSAGCNAEYGFASQHEIGRIARMADSTLRVAYAVNSPQMSAELRQRFSTLLDGDLATLDHARIKSLASSSGTTPGRTATAPDTPKAADEIRGLLEQQTALLRELDRLGEEAQKDTAPASEPAARSDLTPVTLHEVQGDGSVGAPTSEFKSTDTGMWALMPLSTRSGADVRVRWIYEEGELGGEQLLREFSLVWDQAYDTVRSLLQPSGLIPVGRYRVEIIVDGQQVGVGRFSVRRAGRFG
ncbi:MAG: hypothetical protein Q6L60_09005 [Thermostichus sp. HHBFW_bins_43]